MACIFERHARDDDRVRIVVNPVVEKQLPNWLVGNLVYPDLAGAVQAGEIGRRNVVLVEIGFEKPVGRAAIQARARLESGGLVMAGLV